VPRGLVQNGRSIFRRFKRPPCPSHVIIAPLQGNLRNSILKEIYLGPRKIPPAQSRNLFNKLYSTIGLRIHCQREVIVVVVVHWVVRIYSCNLSVAKVHPFRRLRHFYQRPSLRRLKTAASANRSFLLRIPSSLPPYRPCHASPRP
jgi:hypothetical protein